MLYQDLEKEWNTDLRSFYDILGTMPYESKEDEIELKIEFITACIAFEMLAIENLTPQLKEEVYNQIYVILSELYSNNKELKEIIIEKINQNFTLMKKDIMNGMPPYDIVTNNVFNVMKYPDKKDSDFFQLSLYISSMTVQKTGIWKHIVNTYKVKANVQKKNIFEKILYLMISVIMFVVTYVGINGGLKSIQQYFKQDDLAELNQLEHDLSQKEFLINAKESELKYMEEEIDRIWMDAEKFGGFIDKAEDIYPEGIPDHDYDKYMEMVNHYHSIIDDYETKLQQYEYEYGIYTDWIDEYNGIVKEAELLAKEVGTSWVILPIKIKR